MAKICRPRNDSRNTVTNANIGDTTIHDISKSPLIMYNKSASRELKAPNWKLWAFTDGSCITNKEIESQSVGAGIYHPQFNKNHHSKS
jgi:hypothetical protein